MKINDYHWVSVEFLLWLYNQGYYLQFILVSHLLRGGGEEGKPLRLRYPREDRFDSELRSSRHNTLIVNSIDISHIYVSVDQVQGVNNGKHVVEFLQKMVCYIVVLALLPPSCEGVVVKPRLPFLQYVKADVVQIIVSKIDFYCN